MDDESLAFRHDWSTFLRRSQLPCLTPPTDRALRHSLPSAHSSQYPDWQPKTERTKSSGRSRRQSTKLTSRTGPVVQLPNGKMVYVQITAAFSSPCGSVSPR